MLFSPELTPYDTGHRLQPMPWLPTDAEVSDESPREDFGKVDFDNESGESICTIHVERCASNGYRVVVTPLSDERQIEVNVVDE